MSSPELQPSLGLGLKRLPVAKIHSRTDAVKRISVHSTMILPDWKIKQYVEREIIKISPFSKQNIQPHSYDITLGDSLKIPVGKCGNKIVYEEVELPIQYPRSITETFALGTTIERFELPANICAQVDGKSTLGRLGLSNHQTAGWIDAGFCGNITLELSNSSPIPVELYPGMKIGQIIFFESIPAEIPYGDKRRCSHYQNQTGITEPQGIFDLY